MMVPHKHTVLLRALHFLNMESFKEKMFPALAGEGWWWMSEAGADEECLWLKPVAKSRAAQEVVAS
jgi:hypothetical protein